MSATHAQDALKRALNGDRETMEPVTRRGLFAVAAETDELRADVGDQLATMAAGLDRLRKAVYGVGGTIIASAIAVIIAAAA